MTNFIDLMDASKNTTTTKMTGTFDATDGSTVYDLCAFNKKERERVTTFFLPANMQYQDMVRNVVAGNLNNLDEIYDSYNKLYATARGVLNKFLFMNNVHNFVCFLQNFKGQLESINITSCIPARNMKAKAANTIKVDKNGFVLGYPVPAASNHPTPRRTDTSDPTAKYNWFMSCVMSDNHDIKDSTIVIRTSDGSGPIKFYNTSEDSIKKFEMDYLKAIYAKEYKVNYLKVRPISFKMWKELPLEKQIATQITQIDVEKRMRYAKDIQEVIEQYNA